MGNLVEKWNAFCEWQRRPSHIPQMTEMHHRCCTCGQEYQGNYCPCCGQSAKIGRYSFKNALLLFLDVWGMGNRGMFRTLRDLILRPGYLIRDYISGMQMAYFPPFKLLFMLTAISLVVDSGVNLKGENYLASFHEKTVKAGESVAKTDKKKEATELERWDRVSNWYIVKFREFKESNLAFFWLALLFILSFPLYLFFRKSPNIPDLRFSELLIALVYIWGMKDIYEIVLTFFCAYSDFDDYALLLCIIPLKQLSGFKWWRTCLYFILSCLAAIVILFAVMLAAVEVHMYLEAFLKFG
jgi:hypothetical protein